MNIKPPFSDTCLPEIGGDAAHYFQNFEPEHLREVFADGMAKVLQDPNHAARMQAQAARFNWQNVAQHYHKPIIIFHNQHATRYLDQQTTLA